MLSKYDGAQRRYVTERAGRVGNDGIRPGGALMMVA